VKDVTMSELHSIMTSGLATIAGGMLAAYISLGVEAQHVLSASVMSAPAALAISKLMYPETEVPATSVINGIHFQKRLVLNFCQINSCFGDTYQTKCFLSFIEVRKM
jgi:nucleoside permease NupC